MFFRNVTISTPIHDTFSIIWLTNRTCNYGHISLHFFNFSQITPKNNLNMVTNLNYNDKATNVFRKVQKIPAGKNFKIN